MRRVLGVISAMFVVFAAVPFAWAETRVYPTDCEHLQRTLDEASYKEGAIVVLSDPDGWCTGAYTTGAVTLQGRDGAGFDGSNAGGRSLTAKNLQGPLRLVDLEFRNGTDTTEGGGAFFAELYAHGVDVHIEGVTFVGNKASQGGAVYVTGGRGGTVTIRDSAFIANEAYSGGGAWLYAASVSIEGSTFERNYAPNGYGGGAFVRGPYAAVTSNRFAHNIGSNGGGLAVEKAAVQGDESTAPPMRIAKNYFHRNNARGDANSALGGGLYIAPASRDVGMTVFQERNDFTFNQAGPSSGDAGGGGEWIDSASLTSLDDRFIDNSVIETGGAKSLIGAGLGGGSAYRPSSIEAANLVVAENRFSSGAVLECVERQFQGEPCRVRPPQFARAVGSGIGMHDGTLLLRNATVTANFFGIDMFGTGTDIGADGEAHLTLTNSIVWTRGDGAEIGGFATRDIGWSDVCDADGRVHPGPGNICADPRLVSLEGHQSAESPTIDAGSDSSVPEWLFFDFDREPAPAESPKRQPRTRDGNGDGQAVVDMGADEFISPDDPCADGDTCRQPDPDPEPEPEVDPNPEPDPEPDVDPDPDPDPDPDREEPAVEPRDRGRTSGTRDELPTTGVAGRTRFALMLVAGGAAITLLRTARRLTLENGRGYAPEGPP